MMNIECQKCGCGVGDGKSGGGFSRYGSGWICINCYSKQSTLDIMTNNLSALGYDRDEIDRKLVKAGMKRS